MSAAVVPDGLSLTPPHDVAAEAAVIGAALSLGRIPDDVADLRPADFYMAQHETLWAAMRALHAAGRPCDPTAVAAFMPEPDLRRSGGRPYLVDLISLGPVVASAGYYGSIVKDRAILRRLASAGLSIWQHASQPTEEAELVLERAEAVLAAVPSPRQVDVSTLMSLGEFMRQQFPPDVWVIPTLLCKGERLILTGTEGLGKSVLMRQMAVCAAAGIHPFSGDFAIPARVLLIDCENPKKLMHKTIGNIIRAVQVHTKKPVPEENMWIDRRPEGLRLTDPADRRWLRQRVVASNPDVLVIGPTYKLYEGGGRESEEDKARAVASALDALREEFNLAIILEHHQPHGESGAKQRTVRPIGSSLWLRWPEFGYGIRYADHPDALLRRLVEFVPWRGPRDERPWPDYLETDKIGLPWIETQI